MRCAYCMRERKLLVCSSLVEFAYSPRTALLCLGSGRYPGSDRERPARPALPARGWLASCF